VRRSTSCKKKQAVAIGIRHWSDAANRRLLNSCNSFFCPPRFSASVGFFENSSPGPAGACSSSRKIRTDIEL